MKQLLMNNRGWVTLMALVFVLAIAIYSFLRIFDNPEYTINKYQTLNWEQVEEDGIQEDEVTAMAGKAGVNLGVVKDTAFIYVDISDLSGLVNHFLLEIENPTFRFIQPYFFGTNGEIVPGEVMGTMSDYENILMQPDPKFEFPQTKGEIKGVVFKILGKEPLKFRAG